MGGKTKIPSLQGRPGVTQDTVPGVPECSDVHSSVDHHSKIGSESQKKGSSVLTTVLSKEALIY